MEVVLGQAHEAQQRWAAVPLAERQACCERAVQAMLAMAPEIVPELAWQIGRPVSQGGRELERFAERARCLIQLSGEALGTKTVLGDAGVRRLIKRTPVGTVLVIAPWNYPYLTAVGSVIPALLAGNAVILKHAAQSLLAGERFERAFREAELPAGLFHNLLLTHEQTERLIESGRIRQVNFVGSESGGRAIERAGAGKFVGVGLELGSKDPAYVRADCDLSRAIAGIGEGAFYNCGQSGCAVERVYVHDSVYDGFIEGLVDYATNLRLGNPLDPATTLGPMVRPAAADFVRDQIGEAVAMGARAMVDPHAFGDARGSAYLPPQVLTWVTHDMAVMQEESFGPVVGVMPVANDDEAVRRINDCRYGLSASIWTQDEAAAVSLGDRLETGTVMMNRCDYLDPALPWSGAKNTGRGATLSILGFQQLTKPKSYHLCT